MKFSAQHATDKRMLPFVIKLGKVCAQWNYLTVRLAVGARKNRDVVGTNAVDFLMYSGYAMMAYFWAQMAAKSFEKLDAGNGVETKEFYEAKVPLRRGTTGADVMRAVYYIIEQAYETGQAIPVTGGQVMLSS